MLTQTPSKVKSMRTFKNTLPDALEKMSVSISAFLAAVLNILLLNLPEISKSIHLSVIIGIGTLVSAVFIFLDNFNVLKIRTLNSLWSNLLIFIFPFTATFLILENQESILLYIYFLGTLFYVLDTMNHAYLDVCVLGSIVTAFVIEKLINVQLDFTIQAQCFFIGAVGFVIFGSYHRYKFNKHAHIQFNKLRMLGAAIAHELRTPLGAISSGIEGLLIQLPKVKDDLKKIFGPLRASYAELDERINNLLKASHAMARNAHSGTVVVDMLLVKIQNENGNVSYLTACDAAFVIQTALYEFPMNTSQRSLIHFKSDYNFTFHSNAEAMKHVIFNLLKNALYQISKHGKGTIEIWLSQNQDFNEIHFKDTAIGISNEKLIQIFEESEDGSGIGLPLCRLIVEKSNGIIDCKARLHEYTEFIIRFKKLKY